MKHLQKMSLLLLLSATMLMACNNHKDKAQEQPNKPAVQAPATEEKPAGQAQILCPIMKSPINKNMYTDVLGKRIYICCPGCANAIKADPAKYIRELEAQGVVLEPAG